MKTSRSRLPARTISIVGIIIIVAVVAAAIYFASKPNQPPATSITTAVAFDFDTGSPQLVATQVTPFDQTVKGLTASFSSPSDPSAFSVRSNDAESPNLSQFSGKYVYDNKPSRDILDVHFSGDVIAVEFAFATIEKLSEGVTIPSDVLITAYKNNNLVGSNRTYGSFSSDSYPQGKLFFTAGLPFNWVRISIPSQTSGTNDFLVDNIIVTIISKPTTP